MYILFFTIFIVVLNVIRITYLVQKKNLIKCISHDYDMAFLFQDMLQNF
ncbi:hypothetical protein rpr22_0409 [Rickettsia prowazekii str. Rp22]|uniref:Uncharacterized protein n=1 Tax=Rickettsia prowazekii (strain Rp22) TaxID=449216 RepID=D5AWX3_RICPP|nr:hypothetical protein rpr22_0409 [Rickettsia prowazekii str. Rp22]